MPLYIFSITVKNVIFEKLTLLFSRSCLRPTLKHWVYQTFQVVLINRSICLLNPFHISVLCYLINWLREWWVDGDVENIYNLHIFFRISKMEFVGIILDVLKLRKNICVCRHFQNLNKSSLFNDGRGSSSIFGTNARKKLYLDVWLVDFFSPSQTNVTGKSYYISYQKKKFVQIFRDSCFQN